MATSAAILDVLVRADTRAATTAIKKYQTTLNRTDQSITSTTRTTGALGKATRSTGSRLASAARYAAGAAAAYLSIAQAKAAITTTQDLAKTTAGLNRNLGFTVKEGSRWASVAKSRDIDAKALTMSFTTLSRRVVEAGHSIREGGGAAETAMVPFTRLGLSQQDVLKGSKDLNSFMPKLADAFGEAEGGAKRQASAQQLLGRGYATVLPLFADGAKGLQEQQKWADKYGTTLNEKTLKAQMDLVSAQRESKVAWLGIQMAFAQGVTPALERANDVFQRIAAIMADKDLTDAEKWKKIGDIIGKWADKLLDVFVKVLPQLVERAAEAAPKIASALIEGITNSPAIGAFLLGGWLLKGALLGGIGKAAGALIGNPMGLAIAATAASAFAGAKLSPKILANKDSFLPMNASEGVEHLADALDITIGHAQRLANFMGKHPGFDTTESLKMMRQQSQHTMNAIKDFGREWGLTANEIRNQTQKNFRRIRQTMGTESMEAKLAVMHNFEGAVQAIKNSMKSGEISAERGAKMIHNVLIKQLKGYGIKDAEGFLNRHEAVTDPQSHAGKQRGGAINTGKPSGDSVPAMLERGEYVLNRNAVSKLGRGALDRINFGEAKRFQSGGMVDPAGPGTGVVNPAIADVVGAWSQHYNAAINYGYDPGGGHVSPGHNVTGTATDTSPAAGWTATATALFEKGLKAVLAQGLTVGYGTAGIGEAWPDHGRGNHAHIEWGMNPSGVSGAGGQVKLPRFSSDFGLGLMVAQGLNNMAAGTEKSVNARLAKMGAGVSGDIGPLGGGALSPAEFSALARQAIKLTAPQSEGFNVAGLLTLAMAESSLNPNSQNTTDINAAAGNPSGGLMQLTESNFRAYHEPGTANNIFDPLANIAASINYQRDRYGSQVTHSPYMRGGFVGMAEGGPVWPEKLLGPNLPSVLQGISQDEGEALQGLMKRIRGAQPNAVDSDGGLLGKLFDLRQMADQNLEWSSLAAQNDKDIPWDLEFNAGKWNIMDEKGKVLQSFASEAEAVASYTEMIKPLLGLFHGHTEQFWRSSELDNLWSLRKRLILAARQMKERREQMHDALQIANERKRDWQHRVNDLDKEGKTPKDWSGPDPVKGEIKDWNDQSDKKRAEQKRKFNREGGVLPGDRAWNGDRLVNVGAGARRVLSALEEKIIPALTDGEGRFNAARVSLLNDHLATVQGTGMSMRGLDERPRVDELVQQFAGEINASAFRLRELRADPRFTDTTEEPERDVWSIGQLLEFAQALRYGAFSQYGYAGEFAKGGFIPRGQYGLVGERGPEFMTGPAQITPAAPTATPMIFADVYIGGEKIDERVQAEITGQKASDNLRLRARHVQR